MTIRWNIRKKRGNLRPLLRVEMRLTDVERELCVPVVSLETDIPKPSDAGWRHCLPRENERAESWRPVEFHRLQTPHHREGGSVEECVLPWREDNAYPEVEAAMESLREAFEAGVRQACDSEPMDLSGELETSAETKRHLAPSLAAARILRLAGTGS